MWPWPAWELPVLREGASTCAGSDLRQCLDVGWVIGKGGQERLSGVGVRLGDEAVRVVPTQTREGRPLRGWAHSPPRLPSRCARTCASATMPPLIITSTGATPLNSPLVLGREIHSSASAPRNSECNAV